MASTKMCRLCLSIVDSRSSVNLFTVIGLKNKWASRISALLLVAVDDDQMLTSHVSTKYTHRLDALEKADIDLHAFKQQAWSSLTALQSRGSLKRPKVTGGKWEYHLTQLELGLGCHLVVN